MRIAISATLALIALATTALAVDVTTPGQTVVDGEVGVLTTDLVCSPPNAIYLGNAATLDLNGHVLDGCLVFATGFEGDTRRIEVRGPGEIRHGGVHFGAGSLRIRDVAISDAPGDGIRGQSRSIVRATNVTITGSDDNGIWAAKVVARKVTVSGSGAGGDLGYGIVGAAVVDGHDVTVTNNANDGVFSFGRVALRNAQVTGNGYDGVGGLSIKLVDSTVTGNASDPDATADLASQVKPRLKSSTCGTSAGPQGSWGVCAND